MEDSELSTRDVKSKSDGWVNVPSSPSSPVPIKDVLADFTAEEKFALYRTARGHSGVEGTKHKHNQLLIGTGGGSLISYAQSSNVTPLSLISQGSQNYNRIGLQIKSRSVTARLGFYWVNSDTIGSVINTEALKTPNPIRLIVLWDNAPLVGGVIIGSDLNPATDVDSVLTTLGQGQINNDIAAYNNITHGTRFEILRDEVICPEQVWATTLASGTTIAAFKSYTLHLDLKDRIMTYQNTANNSQLDHALQLLLVCNQPITTTPANVQCIPTVVGTVDFTFSDLVD